MFHCTIVLLVLINLSVYFLNKIFNTIMHIIQFFYSFYSFIFKFIIQNQSLTWKINCPLNVKSALVQPHWRDFSSWNARLSSCHSISVGVKSVKFEPLSCCIIELYLIQLQIQRPHIHIYIYMRFKFKTIYSPLRFSGREQNSCFPQLLQVAQAKGKHLYTRTMPPPCLAV